jgi:DNA invertase Pin-like site-specific DNA recombinase
MVRPALQNLLIDVQARWIDVIVVYKRSIGRLGDHNAL